MQRFLYRRLEEWKTSKNRKPLLLYGARQTGKTFLLSEFGRKEFTFLHYLNFEKDAKAKALFEETISSRELLSLLELYFRRKIDPAQDIIFLDEIQECPRAVTSLKYFYEEMPELAVCCAGSFIGLLAGTSSFPVGKVTELTLYPMLFSEFLSELNPDLYSFYMNFIEKPGALSRYVHEELWKSMLMYYFTGGMPEAVDILVEEGTLSEDVRRRISSVHSNLLTGYRSDFAKHSGAVNAHHINRVFDQVPAQLAKDMNGGAARFTFKGVLPKANRYRDVVGPLDWLRATGMVYAGNIIESPVIPLQVQVRESIFKLFLFDIGLLHAMLDISASEIVSTSYGSYKGFTAENFVASQLIGAGVKRLYTWKGHTSEIEFLLLSRGEVIPIEVKAGMHTRRAKSLQVFKAKYHPPLSVKMSGRNFSFSNSYLNIPLYAAGDIFRILDSFAH